MEKKFINKMPTEEILEAVIFFVSNEKIIKKINSGSKKPKELLCVCNFKLVEKKAHTLNNNAYEGEKMPEPLTKIQKQMIKNHLLSLKNHSSFLIFCYPKITPELKKELRLCTDKIQA